MRPPAELRALVERTGREIGEAQFARSVIPPRRRLSDLSGLIEEHRVLAARHLAGDDADEARRLAVRSAIESIQGHSRAPAATWRRAAKEWRQLAQAIERRAIGAEESDAWHAGLVTEYKACFHGLERIDRVLARRVDDLRQAQRRYLASLLDWRDLPNG
jgi:hypothetical protein